MKNNYHSDSGDTRSIRQRIFDVWVQNPYLKAKKICKMLKLNYKKQGHMVNVRLSEFRSYYDFGSPLKPQVPHRRVFVWECVPRSLLYDFVGGEEFDSGLGWRVVSNRNGMLVFKGDVGSVHWYRGGKVMLYLRGAVKLARAKELFCKAFSWFTGEQLSRFLDVPLREESRHWVFELGTPVPRFDIRKFERSHGIRIFADKSHATAIEVSESTPFWIGQLQETMGEFSGLHRQFAANLEEHMKLIKEWQREARSNRKYSWFRNMVSEEEWNRLTEEEKRLVEEGS